MTYQHRFVIFIDILGFKEIIKTTNDNEGNDLTIKIDALNLSSSGCSNRCMAIIQSSRFFWQFLYCKYQTPVSLSA